MTRITGGRYRNRKLSTPKGWETRPSASRLREALFNICQAELEGARVLDLFAGSGALGFEALSRGATHCTFVDQNQNAVDVIRKNADTMMLKGYTKVIRKDVFKFLASQSEQFDLILIDPPYSKGFAREALERCAQYGVLAPGGSLFVEEGADVEWEFESPYPEKSHRRIGAAQLRHYICPEDS